MGEARATPDVQLLLEQAHWLAPLVRGLLRDSQDVEDVLQETWLRALQHPPRMEGFASPRAWLARVALRIAMRHRERSNARRWREGAVAKSEEGVEPEAVAERVRLQRELAEHVLQLAEPYRTAITLRYLEGLSCAELAGQLGISGEAARKRVSRGLEQLRQRLDEANGGEREGWTCTMATIAWLGPRKSPLAPSAVRSVSWVGITALVAVTVIAGALMVRGLARPEARRRDVGTASSVTGILPVLSADDALSSRLPRAFDPAVRIPLGARPESPSERSGSAPSLLRGRVLDPAGEPVVGAAVEVRHPDRSAFDLSALTPSDPLIAHTRTDERGEFALEVPAELLCDLWIKAEPFALALLPDRRAGDDERIELHPAAQLVVSLNEKASGSPVAGARYRILALWLSIGTSRELARGQSDASGRFEVGRLPAGRLLLDVITENGADVSTVLDVAAGEQLERVFRLDPACLVQGVVRDGSTSRPIVSAEVVAAPGASESSLVPESIGRGWKCRPPVRTDAGGHFRVAATPGFLPSTLFVSARGYGSATVELGAGAEELTITLDLGRSVTGRLLSESGEPVADARVVAAALEPGPGLRQVDWKEARTGADGSFFVEDVRADLAYVLRIAKQGQGACIVTLAAASAVREQQLGTLILPGCARITGQVVDSSAAPVAGAYVHLGWTSTAPAATRVPELVRTFTRADQDGRFAFADVVPGNLALRASLGGRNTPLVELVVAAGGTREDVRLAFSAAGRIAGTVVDAFGKPMTNACVLLDPEERTEEPEVRVTGADGRFEFAPAQPGPFGLRAVPNSIHLEGGNVLVHAIDLPGIEAGSEDLRVVLPPAELVTGWLLSPRAEPLANVVLFARDARGRLLTYDYSDPEGRILLRLPPGSVVDLCTKDDAGKETVHRRAVPAGSLDLELVLGLGPQ